MLILKQAESVPENSLPVLQFKTSSIFYSKCWQVAVRLLGGFVLSLLPETERDKGSQIQSTQIPE